MIESLSSGTYLEKEPHELDFHHLDMIYDSFFVTQQASRTISSQSNKLLFQVDDLRQRVRRGAGLARLPTEIVVYIFTLASGGDSQKSVCLSHVCQRWRTVALSTPRMWTYINHRNAQYFDFVLPRSTVCSLNIVAQVKDIFVDSDVNLWDKHSDIEDELMEELARAITPHSSRWKMLDLVAYDGDLIRRMLNLFKGLSVPRLEQLVLSAQAVCNYDELNDTDYDGWDEPYLPFPFTDAGVLQELRLFHVVVDPRTVAHQITTLKIESSAVAWDAVLILAPTLREAVWYFTNDFEEATFRHRPVLTMEKLKLLKISIDNRCWGQFSQLLDKMVAPELSYLSVRIEPPENLDFPVDPAIPQPSPTHFPSLTHLTLKIVDKSEKGNSGSVIQTIFPHMLLRIPTVTQLRIKDCRFVAFLFRMFTSTMQSQSGSVYLLPSVENLSLIRCSGICGQNLEQYIRVWQSREDCTSLKRLELIKCPIKCSHIIKEVVREFVE